MFFDQVKECVMCGMNHVHLLEVTYFPDGNTASSVPVTLRSRRGTGKTDIRIGEEELVTPTRGGGVLLVFGCENGDIFQEYFGFHKGLILHKTYLSAPDTDWWQKEGEGKIVRVPPFSGTCLEGPLKIKEWQQKRDMRHAILSAQTIRQTGSNIFEGVEAQHMLDAEAYQEVLAEEHAEITREILEEEALQEMLIEEHEEVTREILEEEARREALLDEQEEARREILTDQFAAKFRRIVD